MLANPRSGGHTGGVITLDIQTWASIATIIAPAIAILTVLSKKTDKVETGLGTRIGELRSDIGKLDTRLVSIEQRTYDLSTRLPPTPAATGTSDT